MSAPRPYSGVPRYSSRGPRFYPRAGAPGAFGPSAGSGSNINGLIGGVAAPLLCFGCLSALALVGLFATMIAAAAYMNQIQQQIRKDAQGAGAMIESNIFVLFSALLCSIYVLTKNRRSAVHAS